MSDLPQCRRGLVILRFRTIRRRQGYRHPTRSWNCSRRWSIPYRSRPGRRAPAKQEGVDYYFRTPEAVSRACWPRTKSWNQTCYCGNYYGTPRHNLENYVNQGIDVLMDITVPGSLAVMPNYPEAVTLFLLPPSFPNCSDRLTKRGTEGSSRSLNSAWSKARDEISKASLFHYIVDQ